MSEVTRNIFLSTPITNLREGFTVHFDFCNGGDLVQSCWWISLQGFSYSVDAIAVLLPSPCKNKCFLCYVFVYIKVIARWLRAYCPRIPYFVQCKIYKQSPSMKPTLTRWEGLSNEEVSTSASTRRGRQSDASTFEQNKQIFFMPMPKTWFKVKNFRLE